MSSTIGDNIKISANNMLDFKYIFSDFRRRDNEHIHFGDFSDCSFVFIYSNRFYPLQA